MPREEVVWKMLFSSPFGRFQKETSELFGTGAVKTFFTGRAMSSFHSLPSGLEILTLAVPDSEVY
jgi:hypothetical protein